MFFLHIRIFPKSVQKSSRVPGLTNDLLLGKDHATGWAEQLRPCAFPQDGPRALSLALPGSQVNHLAGKGEQPVPGTGAGGGYSAGHIAAVFTITQTTHLLGDSKVWVPLFASHYITYFRTQHLLLAS